MGYVSESQTDPAISLNCSSVRVSTGTVLSTSTFVSTPGSKSQYGFRSGSSYASLDAHKDIARFYDKHGQWADQASMLELLDEIQRSTTSGRTNHYGGSLVNFRDAYQTRNPPGTLGFVGYYLFGGVLHANRGTGAMQITSAPWVPPMPLSQAQSWGASALRAATPTRPDFNLTRFIGELRDTNRIFKVGNYIPNSPGDLGGSHLNYQFGIQPTVSDLHQGAEAVLNADRMTREFVRDSFRLVKRSRVLSSTSSTASSSSALSSGGNQSIAGVTVRSNAGNGGTEVGYPTLGVTASSSLTQRCGTYFEYFVGDPYGYTSRMDSYVAQAEKVLGGGLNPSTAYDLTPFSWMLDWFVDIGSLLSYQQQIADNSLTYRNGFCVTEATSRAHAVIGDRGTEIAGSQWARGAYGQASYTRKEYHRTPGSPYSLSPTWSLNPAQWAIVAALGLTKADRIPWIKNI